MADDREAVGREAIARQVQSANRALAQTRRYVSCNLAMATILVDATQILPRSPVDGLLGCIQSANQSWLCPATGRWIRESLLWH